MPNLSKDFNRSTISSIVDIHENLKFSFDENKITPPRCPYCQQPTHIIDGINSTAVRVTCETYLCIGNQDTPRLNISNAQHRLELSNVGNVDDLHRSPLAPKPKRGYY